LQVLCFILPEGQYFQHKARRPCVNALYKYEKSYWKRCVVANHANTKYNNEAVRVGCDTIRAQKNPQNTVPVMISAANRTQYENNLQILKSVVSAILLCGKQNIALRGHRDDNLSTSASNKGNFPAILNLMAASDQVLRKHLDTSAKNAKYTSKTIQNKIIEIIGDQIRMRIADSLGQDNAYFSIIGDEVTDKHANQEMLSVCLRFLDNIKGNPEVREVFFDFVYVERTTGESIAKGIVDCLFRRGIDIRKARGQAYDGASSMSSSRVGVQARTRLLSPRALYTHCHSHVLNLTVASSCKIPHIRNMVDSLNETFKFFNYSPKRQRFFEIILTETQETSKVRKLKGLCKTRWVERHTCYESFYDLYPKVCLCLEEITNPSPDNEGWGWDRETRIKAQGLLSTLKTFTHLISFIIAKNALHFIKGIASIKAAKEWKRYL
jgi:hypothetical protein